MKYLKMLGLAAVAAAAMTAILGAGTASATVLCETNLTTGCIAANWHVANGTQLDFSLEPGTSATLTDPFGGNIATCTESTVKGKTTSTGGETKTVTGNIESLSFSGCNRGVHVNAATTGTLEIHHETGTDNGTVTSNDTEVTITTVPFFGTCKYRTNNTDIGTLFGSLSGTDPTFKIGASIPSVNGCPTGTWEGSYEYTGNTTFIVGTD